jgi:hypothetical protein
MSTAPTSREPAYGDPALARPPRRRRVPWVALVVLAALVLLVVSHSVQPKIPPVEGAVAVRVLPAGSPDLDNALRPLGGAPAGASGTYVVADLAWTVEGRLQDRPGCHWVALVAPPAGTTYVGAGNRLPDGPTEQVTGDVSVVLQSYQDVLPTGIPRRVAQVQAEHAGYVGPLGGGRALTVVWHADDEAAATAAAAGVSAVVSPVCSGTPHGLVTLSRTPLGDLPAASPTAGS